MKVYRCTYCKKEFEEQEPAELHACVCGMKFERIQRTKEEDQRVQDHR